MKESEKIIKNIDYDDIDDDYERNILRKLPSYYSNNESSSNSVKSLNKETQSRYPQSSYFSEDLHPNTINIENTTTDEEQYNRDFLKIAKSISQEDQKLSLSKKSQKITGETADEKLENIKNFRNLQYFDTHSTEDLLKPIPPHTCVHKFELDDRFLPHPLNADPYDVSRCIICGKPMEKLTVSRVDERNKRNNLTRSASRKYQKKRNLVPKKIYIGSGNVKIDVLVDDDQKDIWKTCQKTRKKTNYFNTFALRYQRGVI